MDAPDRVRPKRLNLFVDRDLRSMVGSLGSFRTFGPGRPTWPGRCRRMGSFVAFAGIEHSACDGHSGRVGFVRAVFSFQAASLSRATGATGPLPASEVVVHRDDLHRRGGPVAMDERDARREALDRRPVERQRPGDRLGSGEGGGSVRDRARMPWMRISCWTDARCVVLYLQDAASFRNLKCTYRRFRPDSRCNPSRRMCLK